MSSEIETPRTRTFSWSDPAAIPAAAAQMSGIELMRAVMAGELPKPPIAELVDMELIAVSEGETTFAFTPAEWMYNPIGSVHGGIAATLLDSCLGCAVHTLLLAGVAYTTTDLHIRYVRAMSSDSGRILATGRVVHPGRRVMIAEATLSSEADAKLIASADTACIILS